MTRFSSTNIFGGGGRGSRGPGWGQSDLGGWAEILQFGWRVGRLFGIEIRLHILLILFAIIEIVRSIGYPWPAFLVSGIGFPIILFGSVLLHELGHCYGAYLVRGGATQIILWPLGGMAMVQGGERSPQNELLVTALGPAVNLLIALPTWLLLTFALPAPAIHYATSSGSPILYYIVYNLVYMTMIVNVGLFLFNMLIPIFPMDCARLVRATMALRTRPDIATDRVLTMGLWVAVFGIIVSLTMRSEMAGSIVPMGPIFMLICVMGILSSLQMKLMLRLGQPVYSSYQSYGGRSFYTATPASWRKIELGAQLKSLWRKMTGGLRRGGRGKGADSPRGRVIDLGTQRAATTAGESERERYFRELKQLEDDLRSAVEQKDFARATRLRDAIAQRKKDKK